MFSHKPPDSDYPKFVQGAIDALRPGREVLRSFAEAQSSEQASAS